MDITNLHFMGEVSPETLIEPTLPEPGTDTAETTAETTIPQSNPYATTMPSDGTAPDLSGEDAEPDETFYRTEGGSWY